jgi:hypothetical protein
MGELLFGIQGTFEQVAFEWRGVGVRRTADNERRRRNICPCPLARRDLRPEKRSGNRQRRTHLRQVLKLQLVSN